MELLLNDEKQPEGQAGVIRWDYGTRAGMETEVVRITDAVTDSNCYMLFKDGSCAVIDPNCFPLIQQVLQKRNIREVLVLLTHEHCDHIGGLNELREQYRALVVSSAACSRGMQNTRKNMSRMMRMFLYYKSGETKMVPYSPFQCRAADVQFNGDIRVPFGKIEIRMKALPGHTHGSSVMTLEGVLFCGDYLLPGEKVLTRLPGGSEEEYETYARPWLRKIPDGTWIFPGHGEAFQMCGEVRKFHEL